MNADLRTNSCQSSYNLLQISRIFTGIFTEVFKSFYKLSLPLRESLGGNLFTRERSLHKNLYTRISLRDLYKIFTKSQWICRKIVEISTESLHCLPLIALISINRLSAAESQPSASSPYQLKQQSPSSYAHVQYYYANPSYSFGYSQPANLIQTYLSRRNQHMPTGYATRPKYLSRSQSHKLANQRPSYSKQAETNSGYQTMDHGSYYYNRNGNYEMHLISQYILLMLPIMACYRYMADIIAWLLHDTITRRYISLYAVAYECMAVIVAWMLHIVTC